MKKGKGAGPSFNPHCRGIPFGAKRGITRLSRTMGFTELSQLPGVPGSIGPSAELDPEIPDPALTVH